MGPPAGGVPCTSRSAEGSRSMEMLRRTLRIQCAAASVGASNYWAAIATICAWGTNFGDIAEFFPSLPVSMMLSGLLLTGRYADCASVARRRTIHAGCRRYDRPKARMTIGRLGGAVYRIIYASDIAGFTSAVRSKRKYSRRQGTSHCVH